MTCAWDVDLLRSQSSFHPSVAGVALVVGLLAVAARWSRRYGCGRVVGLAVVAGLGTVLALAVPVGAWGLATAGTPHSGSIPTAVASSGSAGFGLAAYRAAPVGPGRPVRAGFAAAQPTGTQAGAHRRVGHGPDRHAAHRWRT